MIMELEEAQALAQKVVTELKQMLTDFTGNDEFEDIGVYGDDGDYPGHEIIRYDGSMIELIEYYEGSGDKDGMHPSDHLSRIMNKYFDEWERENHFCLTVYGIRNSEA